jgi:hypothetical protein
MTFGTSNLLLVVLAEGYMIIKGVLDSTRPGLHNGLRKIKNKKKTFQPSLWVPPYQKKYRFSP